MPVSEASKDAADSAEAEFGGVPLWLLTAYLVELGGAREGRRRVAGRGWLARLRPGRTSLDGLRIGRVKVTISGPAAAGVMASLRAKAQRGGG